MSKTFNDFSQLTKAILKKDEPKVKKPAPVQKPIPHPPKKSAAPAAEPTNSVADREKAACLDYFSHTSLTERGYATEGRTVRAVETKAKSAVRIKAVHHIAIICSDYPASLAFYRDVLGLTVVAEHYRAARDSYKTDLALNGTYLVELFSFPNPPRRVTNPEAAGLRHLAFAVEDLAAAVRVLDAKDVAHEEVRVDEFTGRRFVFFKDPDGTPIEFYEA